MSTRKYAIVASVLAALVFGEAIFAGAMLSGVPWAQAAHAWNARILIAGAIVAALAAIFTPPAVKNGKRQGWIWLSIAALFFIQSALGAMSAKGANLLWVHIPLGVALFGFAAHSAFEKFRVSGE